MEIYITNGKTVIQLPVLPQSFSITTGMANTVVNIQSIGEVNLIGKRVLDSISIASFFPAQSYDFIHGTFKKPYEYCKTLRKWKNSGDVVNLNITGTNINLSVVIEGFTFGEDDRSGDVTYNIDFKEYRQISTARVTKKIKKTTYKCKEGDTFYTIARKFTGSSNNAKAIAKKNKMKVSAKLKKGKKLVIEYEA